MNIVKNVFPIILIFHLMVILIYVNENSNLKSEKMNFLNYNNLTLKQRRQLPAPHVTPYDQVHKTSRTLFWVFWGSMAIYFIFFSNETGF
jgi:hypothetical protein